jgi:signal transduction histidine kinase
VASRPCSNPFALWLGWPICALLLPLLLPALLCSGGAAVAAEIYHPTVLQLAHAFRSDAGDVLPLVAPSPTAPANAGSAPTQVALPDNWDSTHPSGSRYAWYTLAFDTPEAWRDQALGVYLPAVGMNAELYLNGMRMGSIGRMEEPVTRHFYTPLLFQMPAGLLKGVGEHNVLQILVVGYPKHRNGLGEVLVGPMEPLRGAWLWRGFWQNTGTLISSVLTLMLGAYVLMLWARERSNAVFGWFGLAALVWGLRNLNLVVTELPLSNLLWSQLSVVGAVGFVGFFALFTLRYCEFADPRPARPPAFSLGWRQWVIWLFMVGATAALLLSVDFEATRVIFKYVGFFGIALTCWTQAKLSALAWRARTAETILIALAGLVYIALMLNDYTVTNDQHSLGQYYLRQYAAMPLFVAVGAMLTRRYSAALEQARSLSDSLQTQVQDQHDLLARNFEKLRHVEREKTQALERERLMRDLHDGLGLHLLSAMVQARTPGADMALLSSTLQDCLDDLRVAVDSLAGDERDPVTVLGTLRYRMAPRMEAAGVKLAWEIDDHIPELPWLDPHKVLHLLRIVQEALTNAMRHSQATVVIMSVRNAHLENGAHYVEVAVSDNGVGLQPNASGGSGGHGVGNMHVRAKSLGGWLRIDGGPPGCKVVLNVPVGPASSTQ